MIVVVDILLICVLLAHGIICGLAVGEVRDVVGVVEGYVFVGVGAIIQVRALLLFSTGLGLEGEFCQLFEGYEEGQQVVSSLLVLLFVQGSIEEVEVEVEEVNFFGYLLGL